MEPRKLNEEAFVRERVFSGKRSYLRKYMDLTTGSPSLGRLLKYELITMLFTMLPGALGLALRKTFFRRLFPEIGNSVIFGKNLTIRHADKIRIGSNVIIDDGVLMDGRGATPAGISIGDNTIIGRNVTLIAKSGAITIGSNCNIGSSSVIVSQGGIEIRDWVQIAGNCEISGGIFRYNAEKEGEFPFDRYTSGKVVIEEKCFIGGFSQILDGVTVGRCSMIGTGCTVGQKIPPHSIFMPRPGMILGTTGQAEEKTG